MKHANTRRILALAFALLLVISAAGCGNKKSTSDTQGGSTSNVSSGSNADSSDLSTIEMPTADLSNNSKVLKVYGWSSMAENNTDGEAADYFKKEFGVTMEETISTHESYWEDLAKMVAAGNAPDVVDLSYDKFYPTPITGGLIVPWDDLIDFSTPLWADTKDLIDEYKWKDKVYYPMISSFVSCWCYYNKNMFKNYGLEDQNPRALWEKGEWTLDKLIELSDQFIEKNNKNEVTQFGFTVQNIEIYSMSGEQIIELKHGTEYTNNLKSAKIAKIMNSIYKISPYGGSGSLTTQDACPVFEQEKCAMLISASTLLLETRFADLRENDALGFAPLPKLDDETGDCVEMSTDPGWGLIKGAKNTELAKLWVEYLKWFRLGENPCVEIPSTVKTAAKERYNLKAKAGSASVSDEDAAFIEKYLATNPKKVYTTYRSLIRNMTTNSNDQAELSTFKWDFIGGKSQWSAVVQMLSPRYEKQLKSWVQ